MKKSVLNSVKISLLTFLVGLFSIEVFSQIGSSNLGLQMFKTNSSTISLTGPSGCLTTNITNYLTGASLDLTDPNVSYGLKIVLTHGIHTGTDGNTESYRQLKTNDNYHWADSPTQDVSIFTAPISVTWDPRYDNGQIELLLYYDPDRTDPNNGYIYLDRSVISVDQIPFITSLVVSNLQDCNSTANARILLSDGAPNLPSCQDVIWQVNGVYQPAGSQSLTTTLTGLNATQLNNIQAIIRTNGVPVQKLDFNLMRNEVFYFSKSLQVKETHPKTTINSISVGSDYSGCDPIGTLIINSTQTCDFNRYEWIVNGITSITSSKTFVANNLNIYSPNSVQVKAYSNSYSAPEEYPSGSPKLLGQTAPPEPDLKVDVTPHTLGYIVGSSIGNGSCNWTVSSPGVIYHNVVQNSTRWIFKTRYQQFDNTITIYANNILNGCGLARPSQQESVTLTGVSGGMPTKKLGDISFPDEDLSGSDQFVLKSVIYKNKTITLRMEGNQESSEEWSDIFVWDVNGKIISHKLTNLQGQDSYSFSTDQELNAGVYILSVINNITRKTTKFVVN
ncbi:MAG TPA: hypothetical protein DDX92_05130 [Flavobacteriales bacterium]|jgi:hypothetical protein|nr:hypothetical protein [Flavobacteriales bacterium]